MNYIEVIHSYWQDIVIRQRFLDAWKVFYFFIMKQSIFGHICWDLPFLLEYSLEIFYSSSHPRKVESKLHKRIFSSCVLWLSVIRKNLPESMYVVTCSGYLDKVWASQAEFSPHSRVTSKCHGLNFTSYWQQFWGFSEVLFHFTVPVLFRHQRIAPTTVQNGKNAPSNAWLFSSPVYNAVDILHIFRIFTALSVEREARLRGRVITWMESSQFILDSLKSETCSRLKRSGAETQCSWPLLLFICTLHKQIHLTHSDSISMSYDHESLILSL